jgi:hypothetical protein
MFNNPYHGIRRPMAPGPNPPRRRFRMPAGAMSGLGLYGRQETMGTFGVPGEAEGDTRPYGQPPRMYSTAADSR